MRELKAMAKLESSSNVVGGTHLVPLLYITILVIAGATAIIYGIATSTLSLPSPNGGQLFQTTGTGSGNSFQGVGAHLSCGNQTSTIG